MIAMIAGIATLDNWYGYDGWHIMTDGITVMIETALMAEIDINVGRATIC
jgi:hypothetical protein